MRLRQTLRDIQKVITGTESPLRHPVPATEHIWAYWCHYMVLTIHGGPEAFTRCAACEWVGWLDEAPQHIQDKYLAGREEDDG